MTTEKIQSALQALFDEPLREYHKRRIVFWYDSDGEFSDMLGELELPGVKLIKLTGSNNFAAKKTLLEDDTDSDFLVYDPLPNAGTKDDWLIDIERYSDEFRADLMSMRMQELGLPSSMDMRKTVKLYAKFFDNKERMARLKALGSEYVTSSQLHVDIMSVLARASENSVSGVIRAVLSAGLDADENAALENIKKFGSEEMFWRMTERYTGYVRPEGASGEELGALASHILLTALSATMRAAFLGGFEKLISEVHQQICYSFVNEWMNDDESNALYDIARDIEEKYDLPERFSKLEPADLMDSECFPCMNECIAARYMNEISEGIVKPDDIAAAVEKRRTAKWYENVAEHFEGLMCVADMQRFYQANAGGFHEADHKKLWSDYCTELYKMDTYYRRFHTAFGRSLRKQNYILEDSYKNVAEYVENLYKNWYLAQLGAKWTQLVCDEMEKDSELKGIPQQEEFYMNYVRPVSESSRVYVVISDALRYEVAAELAEKLTGRTRGTAELSAVQAVFPSITKFGMAALLPHYSLSTALTADGIKVLCDGMSADSTEDRELVLKKFNSKSVALTYRQLLKMKQAERRECVSGADVVYIYHNSIDAVGDKLATEDQVFEACEEAVDEIQNLVKIITNSMSGTNVIITADHGFLYSYRPLEERDKAEKRLISGEIIELGRRYVIADGECTAEHMVRIPMKYAGVECTGFAPLDDIRIKKPGGGMNYVHGGISLQECVVPVIQFKNMRASSKNFVETKKVELKLLSRTRRVSNNMFSLEFFQTEAVGGKNTSATYEIYMADASGVAVSSRQTVIADRTSDNSSERVFKVRFDLKGQEFNKNDVYYMTIVDTETGNVADRVEFSISIAFVDDFGF